MKSPGDEDVRQLIADYMENGFLENIIDMFRQDSNLYAWIGDLIQDERVRVRIGITALVEELKKTDGSNLFRAVQNLLPLLDQTDAVVRGDAANLLGIIGDKGTVPAIEKLLTDDNHNVRLIAEEALLDMNRSL